MCLVSVFFFRSYWFRRYSLQRLASDEHFPTRPWVRPQTVCASVVKAGSDSRPKPPSCPPPALRQMQYSSSHRAKASHWAASEHGSVAGWSSLAANWQRVSWADHSWTDARARAGDRIKSAKTRYKYFMDPSFFNGFPGAGNDAPRHRWNAMRPFTHRSDGL